MARRDTIERKATRLLREAGIDGVPVPVDEVASNLGIDVQFADLDEGCSGVLVRGKSGKRPVIGVNWADHPNRQRFTIAHEIGHYLLHKGSPVFVDTGHSVSFRSTAGSGSRREEVEANWFAAALLMPKGKVEAAFADCEFGVTDDDDLRALATQFGVSRQAMAIRLSVLADQFDEH